MNDDPLLQLKDQLPHTWSPFFAQHGSFTPAQTAAIPPILAGQNTLVMAATASGKTEAVIVPLLERYLLDPETQTDHRPRLSILYICPTRALVRDLYERLSLPLGMLNVALTMKSGDTGPVSTQNPPAVLITTPESTDSLLTRAPRLLATLDAVVLDEIHLFDDGPRGDHIRCLLRRIEHIRRYRAQEAHKLQDAGQDKRGDADKLVPLQIVALSATIPNPTAVAQRYLRNIGPNSNDDNIALIQVPGRRKIEALLLPTHGLDDLLRTITMRMMGHTTIRKTLIFCNSRNEVEQIAAYLRTHLTFDCNILVHYSNLDPAMRREVEDRFAQAAVALCVCTSTLELGIDIGSIDDVILIGPPPTATALLQRIGRGGRRTSITKMLGLFRSPLEEARFQGLLALIQAERPVPLPQAHLTAASDKPPFYTSVLVQQIFSILKQSPTGGIRLADLRRVTPTPYPDHVLSNLLTHLVSIYYLKPGRMGEWRAGPALEELVDIHEIYSNIGADPLSAVVVDAYTGRTIAQADRIHLRGETLLMGGRVMEIVWRDRYRLGVRPRQHGNLEETMRFASTPFAVPFDVSQAVARNAGLQPGELSLLHTPQGSWLFHFWGDIYGELLAALLRTHFVPADSIERIERSNEHCLRLSISLSHLPPWNEALVIRQAQILAPRLEPFLNLGRFHSLLPPELATQTILDHVNVALFQHLYQHGHITTPSPTIHTHLLRLLE